MALSLPNDLPDDYNYIAVGEGQFRIKEVQTEESALVSEMNTQHCTFNCRVQPKAKVDCKRKMCNPKGKRGVYYLV